MTTNMDIRRSQEITAAIITGIAIFMLLTLAACGGSNDGNGAKADGSDAATVPVYSGATKLDDASATKQEIADLGFKASDVTAVAYKTRDAFESVSSFYTEDVEAQGWQVDSKMLLGDQAVAVLTNGTRVAYVMLTHGAAVEEFIDTIQTDALELDASSIAETETLVVFLQMTCDEATVTTCATFGA